MIGLHVLTNTRMTTFKACRQKHYLRYECGIRRVRDEKALRFGTVYDKALEALANGESVDTACALVYAAYARQPDYISEFDWAIEREECLRLVAGYAWRWEDDKIENLAAQWEFDVPIINPATGRPSRTFRRRGKIDGVVRYQGEVALKEIKTAGVSIAPESDYWPHLAIDSQIIGYVEAAQADYPDVSNVLYDATRKPTIEPKQIPLVDDFGLKIVLDEQGQRVKLKSGLPRQSGDAANGWTLQTRTETPQEYGDRLTADIGERPEFYYARRMLPVTAADIAAYRTELWSIATDIREGVCYRNTSACLSPYRCEFTDLCFYHIDIQPNGDVPVGFERMANVHPELEEREIDNGNSTNSAAAEPAFASAAAGE